MASLSARARTRGRRVARGISPTSNGRHKRSLGSELKISHRWRRCSCGASLVSKLVARIRSGTIAIAEDPLSPPQWLDSVFETAGKESSGTIHVSRIAINHGLGIGIVEFAVDHLSQHHYMVACRRFAH